MGLYAAMAGMFTYALFGTSRQLAVTPTSSSAAILAALVVPIAAGDPARYVVLASGAAIAAGIIFLAGGLLRLGAVSEFISKSLHELSAEWQVIASSELCISIRVWQLWRSGLQSPRWESTTRSGISRDT
jgi:hypothetical protein